MKPNYTIVVPTVQEQCDGILYTWRYGYDFEVDAFFTENEFAYIKVFIFGKYLQLITIEQDNDEFTVDAVAGLLSGIYEVALHILRCYGVQL